MNRLSLDRTQQVLDAARGIRVLVVGDVMLDVYFQGAASRISPEAPVPVVRVEEEWRALGGAANVAANVRALGAACELIGCIGDDGAGHDLRTELRSKGIGEAGMVVSTGRPTTVKTRVMARHQQVARFDHESDADLDAADADGVIAAVTAHLADVDALVLEDYNKGMLTPVVIQAVVAAAASAGIPVVVDPKLRHFFDYAAPRCSSRTSRSSRRRCARRCGRTMRAGWSTSASSSAVPTCWSRSVRTAWRC
jgi:D-glycero-beta-D-manno-heptose-7-phosphate kinase